MIYSCWIPVADGCLTAHTKAGPPFQASGPILMFAISEGRTRVGQRASFLAAMPEDMSEVFIAAEADRLGRERESEGLRRRAREQRRIDGGC